MYSVGEISAKLTLDRSDFSAGLAAARKEGESMEGRRFTAKLDANDGLVKRKVQSLRNDLQRFGRQVARPKVDVDVRGAAQLTGLGARIRALPREHNVDVKVHVERGVAAFGSLVRAATSMRVTAVVSLLALAPAAVAAGGAIGGVGVAFLALLPPLGLLGVAMRQAFKQGGPEVRAFKTELKGLKAAFADAVGPGAREAFKGLTSLLANLRGVLPGLQGDFTKLGKAVGTMFKSVGQQLSSSRFQEFFSMLTRSATQAVPSLTRSLKALLDIFRNIATAAMPLLLRGLDKLAGALEKVAKSTSDHDKLRAVFEAGAKALGKFYEVAKNVASIGATIFKAGSSGSSDFLAAIGRATKGLADFFKSKDGQETLKATLASLALFIEEIARAIPPVVRAFGKLLDIVRPIYKAATALVTVLSKLPGGETIGTIALGFLAWKGPLGTAKLALTGILALLGKIKAARVTGALIPAVGGAKGAAAGQMALFPASAGKQATAQASKAGATAGKAGFIAGLLSSIKGGGSKVTGAIKGLLVKVGPLFKRIPGLGALGTVIGAAFSKLPGKLGPLLKTAFGKVFSLLGRALPTLVKSLLPRVLTAFLSWPVAIAALLYSLLPKKIKDAIKKAIMGALGAIKDAGVAVAKAIGQGIAAAGKFVWDATKKIVTKAWGIAKGLASKFLDAGKAVIQAVAKGATAAAKFVWEAAKKIVTKAWEIIKGFAGKFLSVGKLLISKLVSGIKSLASKVAGAVKSVATAALKIVTDLGKRFFDAGKAIIGKLIDGIKSMAGAAASAVGDIAKSVVGFLPGSEPKDTSSPLYGLSRRGRAIAENIAKGVKLGKGGLRGAMGDLMEEAYKPVRNAAKMKLAAMDRQDALNQAPAPTRGQQVAEMAGRVNAARHAVDERGVPLNNPPPGVRRIASQDERDAMAEQAAQRRGFEREDLETAANVKISALLPSDPRVLREAQRAIGRSVRQSRRRRHRPKRRS